MERRELAPRNPAVAVVPVKLGKAPTVAMASKAISLARMSIMRVAAVAVRKLPLPATVDSEVEDLAIVRQEVMASLDIMA